MSQRTNWSETQYQEFLRKRSVNPVRTEPLVRIPRGKTRTEAEFELILKSEHPSAVILFEAYTLKLAPDTRYTPDYAVVEDNRVSFYEVKGRYVYEKALNKPKIAAAMFPQHKFFLAMKSDNGWSVRYLRSE